MKYVVNTHHNDTLQTTLTNQLIGYHLIIIKQPEHFPKFDRHRKSMNKLTPNEPAKKSSNYAVSDKPQNTTTHTIVLVCIAYLM